MWTIWTLWPGANNWAKTDLGSMSKSGASNMAWALRLHLGRRHRIHPTNAGRPSRDLI